jgi:hypothetical protein
MSASNASAIQQSHIQPTGDPGYAWFLANSTELYGIFASDELLVIQFAYTRPAATRLGSAMPPLLVATTANR